MARNNNAPVCRWVDSLMRQPEGVTRQTLFVNGTETPFFVVVSERAAHRTSNHKAGLFGAGMHPRGIALELAAGPRVTALKHRAEQLAMEAA